MDRQRYSAPVVNTAALLMWLFCQIRNSYIVCSPTHKAKGFCGVTLCKLCNTKYVIDTSFPDVESYMNSFRLTSSSPCEYLLGTGSVSLPLCYCHLADTSNGFPTYGSVFEPTKQTFSPHVLPTMFVLI